MCLKHNPCSGFVHHHGRYNSIGIYPFHRWLLAMTAPTPASALMHAGFVNGSGIGLILNRVICLEYFIPLL
jgi:formate hydrogenlyase subunit 3/multisubunit Na+/H+ antiporter MnhD subunit